ncbi:unnamed protein product [Angiostrongylus costaricensis]|uniref:Polyprotein n=1 Tax=Angiostrongylus costaricensis TaxID=334426 RepID=A0A0R3PJE5_ANGCS|nr:unnamed protein product [Angiostrongylus costaricensis]
MRACVDMLSFMQIVFYKSIWPKAYSQVTVKYMGVGQELIRTNKISIFSRKGRKVIHHPTVSRWLASCDFASVPDIEEYSTGLSTERVIVDSILGGNFPEGDCDGYITALENLGSEDDPCDDIIGAEPSSSIGTQKTSGSSTFIDEDSVYETSDELVPNELGTALPATCSEENNGPSWEYDESDIVEELVEACWERNYDARPICPLPTPLRKNLISPRVNLETLVDRKGRVRRTERVKLYLDQIRQTTQHLKS